MKIPFDIKYRPQIESGEYEVVTRNGYQAKIVYWELKGKNPIIAIIDVPDYENGEINTYGETGRYFLNEVSPFDLLIVLPGPELTPFEDKLLAILTDARMGVYNLTDPDEAGGKTRELATQLLDLAKEELDISSENPYDIDVLHGMVTKEILNHITDSDDHGNKQLTIAICNLQEDIDRAFESFKELADEKR